MISHTVRALTLATALASALSVGSIALASGPGGGQGNGNDSTGRGQTTVACSDGNTYTVATANPDNANSAAQIVGEKGHAILSSGVFTLLDQTQNLVVETDTFGHGTHPNQETMTCSGQVFGPLDAADAFGPELPPGVNPTDQIVGTIEVVIVPKF